MKHGRNGKWKILCLILYAKQLFHEICVYRLPLFPGNLEVF